MTTQSIDLRYGPPAHLHFGDEASEAQYLRRVAEARASQRAPFTVAPDCVVPTRRGVLEAGAEVRVEDLDDAYDERGMVVMRASGRLHQLVRAGVVLERLT